MIETEKVLAERVATGAALLDERVPGWEHLVPITKLDMGVGFVVFEEEESALECGCVGAWLDYRLPGRRRSGEVDFIRGLARAGIGALVRGGFLLQGSDESRYSTLTRLWQDAIRSRRARRRVVTR